MKCALCPPLPPLPPRAGFREGRRDSCVSPPHSCVFEPEGNACSLTDSTAEEHVLALVEHAADEARDRISRLVPGGKVAPPRGGRVICQALACRYDRASAVIASVWPERRPVLVPLLLEG